MATIAIKWYYLGHKLKAIKILFKRSHMKKSIFTNEPDPYLARRAPGTFENTQARKKQIFGEIRNKIVRS